MRGTVNEGPLFRALASRPYLNDILDFVMLSKKNYPWLSCSPQSITFLDVDSIVLGVGRDPTLSSIEIKTSVASLSMDRALHHSSHDVTACSIRL